jgi:CheY-like chemotaxis protein
MLEQLGYHVRIVNSPEAALQALAAGENIDLVFSDIVMPGPMNGIALARTVQERFPNLPVLLSTGYNKPAGEAQGEFAMIRKPYQMSELGRAVAHLITSAQAAASAPNLVRFHKPRKTPDPSGRPK